LEAGAAGADLAADFTGLVVETGLVDEVFRASVTTFVPTRST
jgi:hypothetical protein